MRQITPIIKSAARRLTRGLSHGKETRIVPLESLFRRATRIEGLPSETVQTPQILSMPLWDEAQHLQTPRYETPPDFTVVLSDVLYCPVNNVILADDGSVVAECMDRKRLRQKPRLDAEVRDIQGYSAVLRSPGKAYYHLLVDRLPRLISLAQCQSYQSIDVINMLVPGGPTGLEEFFVPRFAGRNMRFLATESDCLFRLEHALVASFKTRRFAGYLPGPYAGRIRTELLPDRPSRRRHRIYVSRETQARRRIENRSELLAALEPLGFVSVVPERLSLEEEIELFYDAEVVIGPHGSGFTNILFADHATMLELYPTRFMVPHFYYLCLSLGHTYDFMCQDGDNRYPESYPVDVRAVVNRLAAHGVS